jgi:hypothetical protein
MPPENVLALLDFSSRLLMPWAGIAFVREAVRESKDTAMFFEVASRRAMFDGTDEEAAWKEVVDIVCQRLAVVVEEAVASPEFECLSIEMLGSIVGYITDGEWSEETVYAMPCESNEGQMRSKVNSQGFCIFELSSGGDVGVFAQADSIDHRHATTLSSCVPFVASVQARARARVGEHMEYTFPTAPFDAATTKSSYGWPECLTAAQKERFQHNKLLN